MLEVEHFFPAKILYLFIFLECCVHNPVLTTSAYIVFHAEGLTGIELHHAAQLTVQPVRGFEDSSHHFPAAESALPAVDEPPVDVPSIPRYYSSGLLCT